MATTWCLTRWAGQVLGGRADQLRLPQRPGALPLCYPRQRHPDEFVQLRSVRWHAALPPNRSRPDDGCGQAGRVRGWRGGSSRHHGHRDRWWRQQWAGGTALNPGDGRRPAAYRTAHRSWCRHRRWLHRLRVGVCRHGHPGRVGADAGQLCFGDPPGVSDHQPVGSAGVASRDVRPDGDGWVRRVAKTRLVRV